MLEIDNTRNYLGKLKEVYQNEGIATALKFELAATVYSVSARFNRPFLHTQKNIKITELGLFVTIGYSKRVNSLCEEILTISENIKSLSKENIFGNICDKSAGTLSFPLQEENKANLSIKE